MAPADIPPVVEQPTKVEPSQAMLPPGLEDMLKKRIYPTLPVPPVCHARLSGEPDTLAFRLTYNGFDVVEWQYLTPCKPVLRFHSDGDFQSVPLIQQCTVAADKETDVRFTVRFPHEMINLRSRRAADGEAILGQWGHPLIHGVNGLYSLDWDYFISWHGYDFTWEGAAVTIRNTTYEACFTIRLDTRPLVLLLRPRYYGMHLGYAYHQPWKRRPKPDAVSGWCSWEAYHDHVTQDHVSDAARALAPLRAYGLDTIQVDDGYQNPLVPPEAGKPIRASWLQTNEKFPEGHAGIVRAILGAGMRAGIWLNASLTHREACLTLPYVLRKADGELLKGDWIQYVLDCTPETLEAEIVPLYRELRMQGYDYIKIDSIRHLIYDGLHEAVRLGLLTDEQAEMRMRAYLTAARKGLGEDAYLLSCWGVLSQSIGLCDAMRVATDTNPSWRAYSMQVRDTARWFFAQRILFTVDPDHVCVRGELPWVRMALSMAALSGSLLMISDKPESYDEERLALIRQALPGLAVRAAETGPVAYETPSCCGIRPGVDLERGSFDIGHFGDHPMPFSSLWCTHFEQQGRRWCVALRCAVVPLEAADCPVQTLGLTPGREYYAFDFRAQTGGPVREDTVRFPALALGDSTTLALTDVTGSAPRLVGSDRHVSADAVSVRRATADGQALRLELTGFEGLNCAYFIYSLEGRSAQIRAEGADTRIRRDETSGLWRLDVRFLGKEAQVTTVLIGGSSFA